MRHSSLGSNKTLSFLVVDDALVFAKLVFPDATLEIRATFEDQLRTKKYPVTMFYT